MKKNTSTTFVIVNVLFLIFLMTDIQAQSYGDYPIIDTGQELCFDTVNVITCSESGEAFYGQDAQFDGNQPSYTDNGDGTVTDLVTGLMP